MLLLLLGDSMRTKERKTLGEAAGEMLAGKKGRSRYTEAWRLYQRWARGEFDIVDPSPPRSLAGYLARIDHSLWLYTSLSIMLITIALVEVTESIPYALPLRYFFGSLFVLFLPGYALVEALYPDERELAPLERLALSIGLSLAVVPLIGLLLNYTPWGIRLEPVMASLAVFTLIMLMVASYRKQRLALLKASAIS